VVVVEVVVLASAGAVYLAANAPLTATNRSTGTVGSVPHWVRGWASWVRAQSKAALTSRVSRSTS
jgi:hypothetical protein